MTQLGKPDLGATPPTCHGGQVIVISRREMMTGRNHTADFVPDEEHVCRRHKNLTTDAVRVVKTSDPPLRSLNGERIADRLIKSPQLRRMNVASPITESTRPNRTRWVPSTSELESFTPWVISEPHSRAGLLMIFSQLDMLIGSDGTADILLDDTYVRRPHARVPTDKSESVIITDLDSQSAMFVSEKRLRLTGSSVQRCGAHCGRGGAVRSRLLTVLERRFSKVGRTPTKMIATPSALQFQPLRNN